MASPRGDEIGHQIRTGLGALVVEQRAQIADDRVRRRDRPGRRRPGVRGEQGAEPPADVGAVRFRYAEQLAHHGERHRERVGRHQVDDIVAAAARSSSSCATMARTRLLQPVDASLAERRGGQPSQPGVVGRVDGEHVAGQRGSGQAFGDRAAVAGQRGVHVLGQPRVVQGRLGLVVAHDQPRRVPVGQAHRVRRARRAHLREHAVRVVAVVVTPRVERRMPLCRLGRRSHQTPRVGPRRGRDGRKRGETPSAHRQRTVIPSALLRLLKSCPS